MSHIDSPRKVAIVTGASRGIGRSVALNLAERGFRVVVNHAHSPTEAQTIVDSINATGDRAIAVQADISSADDVSRMFDVAEETFGGVDALVNNAGIFTASLLAQTDDELFSRQFEVNVRGTFNTLREAAKRLRNQGRVVNLSSTTLALNSVGYGVYNATKGAVEGFTRVLAKELGIRGITVNAVAPGPVETDLFMRGKTDEDLKRLATLAPQGRIGQPDDIANLIAFLLSPEAAWVSGQVIRANGGVA